jgi:MFS transporter, FSR family, fosmidomycin resistance protein
VESFFVRHEQKTCNEKPTQKMIVVPQPIAPKNKKNIMKKEMALPLTWGLLHGLNDFASGFVLSHYMLSQAYSNSYILLIVYSILAFGFQLPLGLLLDKTKNLELFGFASLYLLLTGIACFFINPYLSVVLVGLASAGVHVVGGSVCLLLHNDKTGPLGIFTAPGVVGLTLGLLAGAGSVLLIAIPVVGVLGCLFVLVKIGFPKYLVQGKKEAGNQLDNHDWVMIGLLLIMCGRSLVYDVINHFAQDVENGVLILGGSAFAGKLIGGFAADKMGWKRWVYITLPLAFIFLQLGKENIVMLAFGIATLQSSVPISLMLMRRSIPNFPATASALSLGTSIALAGLPLYAINNKILVNSWFETKWLWAMVVVAMALLFGFIVKADKKYWRLNNYSKP